MTKKSSMLPVTRRQVIKAGGAALAVGGLGTVIGAPAIAANKAFKIGYVSPETGPLAAFGEADAFVLDIVRKQFKDGVKVGGKMVPVDIIVKDSQSNPNRAAEVAADLILKDNVDLMLSSSTPETTNPVSDQAETNEVPVAALVLLARRQARCGLQIHLSFLLGPGRRHRRVPVHVGTVADQQAGRRALPQ
jgi:branched-chain amino acid transport system substrate-binding protein